MLKVMITEDEIWVLRLIRDSIDWESLDMQVVCEAGDGQEALNKLKQYSPDIVISDVRMPNIDGVTLVKLARESGSTAKFIMLSGYQDFEYVQMAIKYNASDYLLKPFDEKALVESLKKVKDEINLQNQNISDMRHLRQQLGSSLNKLRNALLLDMLYGKNRKPAPIDRLNQEYCFSFKEGVYRVVYFKRTGSYEKNKAYDTVASDSIISNFDRHIAQYCHMVLAVPLPFGIAVVLNYPDVSKQQIGSALPDACHAILREMQANSAASTSVGIGSCEYALRDLFDSMRFAEDSANCMLHFGCNNVYDIKNYSFKRPSVSSAFSADKQSQLVCLVEVFNKEEITEYIHALFEPFLSERIHPRAILDLSDAVLDVIYASLKKIEAINDLLPPFEDVRSAIERCFSRESIPRLLISLIADVFTRYYEKHNGDVSFPIRIAKKYISAHYGEQIKLQDIAKMVYLSPQYFSELFKRDVGCTFSDYLSKYRIDVSKDLLLDARYRIKDINYMVGYKDSKSFSKLFKQYMGISPLEYRKLHM